MVNGTVDVVGNQIESLRWLEEEEVVYDTGHISMSIADSCPAALYRQIEYVPRTSR